MKIKQRVFRHDVDEGVTHKMLYIEHRASLTFEESEDAIWILNVITRPEHQNKGCARALIKALQARGKQIFPGSFTDDGLKFIARYFSC